MKFGELVGLATRKVEKIFWLDLDPAFLLITCTSLHLNTICYGTAIYFCGS